jgi:hypothetical protein
MSDENAVMQIVRGNFCFAPDQIAPVRECVVDVKKEQTLPMMSHHMRAAP